MARPKKRRPKKPPAERLTVPCSPGEGLRRLLTTPLPSKKRRETA